MDDEDEGTGRQDLDQLLQELRVMLPGVEVLFAFLLTVPFSNRFEQIATPGTKTAYFVAFLGSSVAAVLLIAPGMLHRFRWRGRGDSQDDRMLNTANRLAIAGVSFLAVAVAAVVLLVTKILFGNLIGALTAGAVVGLVLWFWYGLPLAQRAGK